MKHVNKYIISYLSLIYLILHILSISDNCLYTTGRRCINGACLDSQCHCDDGWGGKGCSMPDENECRYRLVVKNIVKSKDFI